MTSLAGYSRHYLVFLNNISKSPNSLVLGVSLRTRDELHPRLVPGGCLAILYNPRSRAITDADTLHNMYPNTTQTSLLVEVRAVLAGSGKGGRVGNFRDGTGIPSVFRSWPRFPDPSPTSIFLPPSTVATDGILCPARLGFRHAVMCFPDISRPVVPPVVPIPYRLSRTISLISHLTSVADICILFTVVCAFSPSYDYICKRIFPAWII